MSSVPRDRVRSSIDRLFGEGTVAGQTDARLLQRYIADGDELAFEALVRRHGPMVLSVCRRVLGEPHDAEDAFQAAFLLLARKARSIWVEGSLGGWLHRVAWRIALEVKSDAGRRRERERQAAERAGGPLASDPGPDDTAAAIHEEIDRLPERYRRPVVLCYLEDMTYQQAASQLQWTEAATRGRLAKARALLRTRLTRRGVTLAGAGLVAEGVITPGSAAAVPPPLRATAVRAARHVALGESAGAGAVSASTMTLARRAARSMMMARLRAVAATAFVVATMTGLAAMGMGGNEPRPESADRVAEVDDAPRSSPDPAKGRDGKTVDFRGKVLGPDGKPAAGAGVFTVAHRLWDESGGPVLRAKADAEGAFRFTVPGSEFDATVEQGPWSNFIVLASADGLGPDWVELKKPAEGPIELRLVEDSVPIVGRILDLQGRPVAGAKVTRSVIKVEGPGGIDPYLKLIRDDPMQASNHNFARSYWAGLGLPGQPASVATDADGRFRLAGIGRDRLVDLTVEGPTIQSATITAMTRDASPVSSPKDAFAAATIYGARFDHLIAPGRALTGVVRDKKTGKPLAGVSVCGSQTNARATTDAEGRYTLPGFPKGKSYGLMVLGDRRPPYFVTCRMVPDTAGLGPLRADVECVPGIPMRLKLIDKETGRPAAGAEVAYWPLNPNPHVREVPGYAPVNGSGPYNQGIRQDDGSYLLGVLPGPGAVVVRTAQGRHRPACVDPGAFFKDQETKPGSGMVYGDRNTLYFAAGEGWGGMPQEQFSAIVLVNPPEDSAPITAEAVLERDPRREVRILGPDGQPLAGVVPDGEGAEATKTPGVMTVSRLNPARPRRFHFLHPGLKLVGFLLARGDEAAPYVVRMQPWGTIAGRLVDAEGRPRPKAYLMTSDWEAAKGDPARGIMASLHTDDEGRFRLEGLVPGQSYSANAVGDEAQKNGFGAVIDRVVLEPGETRDLGDVRAREIKR